MSGRSRTTDLERQTREELISGISENIDLSHNSHNQLLEDEFGIRDIEDLINLSIPKLMEIADFLDEVFC